jgi:hypothetical protein
MAFRQLRLRLLHARAGLVHLALQRSRIDLGEDVSELHLLADDEADRLQLAPDLEGEAADLGRLQHARKASNPAFGPRSDLVGAQTADRCFAGFLLPFAAAGQSRHKSRSEQERTFSSPSAATPPR